MSIIDAIIQNDGVASIETSDNYIILFHPGTLEKGRPTMRSRNALGDQAEGQSYLKGTFVGKGEKDEATSQKVINVWFSSVAELYEVHGSNKYPGIKNAFVLLAGRFGTNETTLMDNSKGNDSLSFSNSVICRYNKEGRFIYREEVEVAGEPDSEGKPTFSIQLKEIELKGEPGSPVVIHKGIPTLKTAPKLDGNRPKRKPIQVGYDNSSRSLRTPAANKIGDTANAVSTEFEMAAE